MGEKDDQAFLTSPFCKLSETRCTRRHYSEMDRAGWLGSKQVATRIPKSSDYSINKISGDDVWEVVSILYENSHVRNTAWGW